MVADRYPLWNAVSGTLLDRKSRWRLRTGLGVRPFLRFSLVFAIHSVPSLHPQSRVLGLYSAGRKSQENRELRGKSV